MRSTVAGILKVNHGGEHGASRIYAAQIAAARLRCPDLVPSSPSCWRTSAATNRPSSP